MKLTIEVSPLPPAPYPKKWAGLFDARLDRRLLCTSRQPLLDAARVLVAEGHDPDTVVVMRHAGSQIEAMRTKLGVAARITVQEDGPRFKPWKPWNGSRIIGETDDAAPQVAPQHEKCMGDAPQA